VARLGRKRRVAASPRAPLASKAPRDARPGQAQSRRPRCCSPQGKPTLVIGRRRHQRPARSRAGEVLALTEAARGAPAGAALHLPRADGGAARRRAAACATATTAAARPTASSAAAGPRTITEISGLIAADRFIRSLGNGSVPGEALPLAREALLHDPYHDEWIAAAVAPPGAGRTSAARR
jgi:hypothetical protein